MCGIAGVLYTDPDRPVDPRVLRAMGDCLAHRGPDAEGFWSAPGIGLVHRRLSIIDLAGGDQPIANEDGSVRVIFNGEIYNFKELRSWLHTRGHQFRTHSDTEVLVHLYEEQGESLVERLRGMFAFALWDSKRRQLLLGRDRLGLKPLYLYRDADKLVFGSELKAILGHPGWNARWIWRRWRTISPLAWCRDIARFLQSATSCRRPTFWQCRAESLDGAPRRYWHLCLEAEQQRSVADWQEAIQAKIDETVKLHLVADVPVGAFLSGGLDSSVVVAACTGASQESLQTFSIGFEEEAYSELPYARQVSERFGTRHHEEIVRPDAAGLLDELTRYYDEPFADSSAIPTFLVSRLASRSVKVVLSGDGGDEAFGGYARYVHDLNEAALRRHLPGWLRRTALRPLARIWPKTDWLPRPLRAKTLLTNLSLDAGAAYANTLSLCRPPLRRRLIAPDLAIEMNGHQPEAIVRESYLTLLLGMRWAA